MGFSARMLFRARRPNGEAAGTGALTGQRAVAFSPPGRPLLMRLPMDRTILSEKTDKLSEEDQPGMFRHLMASRTVIVSGSVTSELAARVIQQLILMDHDDSKKRITLFINSPGGDFFSGFAIYDTVRYITAPVVSVIVGLAASMGSIIPLAAPKGSRFALPHSKFLIHQPLLMGFQGRATDMEIQAKEILRDRERVVQIYAEHTGRNPAEIERDIDRDKWMTPEEAQEYGLIERIIVNRTEIEKR